MVAEDGDHCSVTFFIEHPSVEVKSMCAASEPEGPLRNYMKFDPEMKEKSGNLLYISARDISHLLYISTIFQRHLLRYQERYIRWAYKFPKSPLPLILNTGNCNNLVGENRSMWNRKLMYLKYGPLGMNYLCMQGGLWEGGQYPFLK